MERLRITKSTSASGVEGLQQILKQKSSSSLFSDSFPCTDGSKIIFELEKRSMMKKSTTEEMPGEGEPKKRAPSVIARLMGVEALPSPKHAHRQQRSSDICQQKTAAHPSSQVHDVRRRRSSIDHQDFKDVYEDLEASHAVNQRCSSGWHPRPILATPDMISTHHNFRVAEHLQSDEMVQNWNGVDDTLEMLEFHECVMPKLHKQPGSFAVKYGPQIASKSSYGSPITVLTPLSSEKYDTNDGCRSEKHNFDELHCISSLARKDGLLLEHHNPNRARLLRSSHMSLLEEDNEEDMPLKRTFTLKPKQGKIRFPGPSCTLDHLPHEYQCKYHPSKEFRNTGGAQEGSRTRKSPSHKIGFPRPISREAMEIARRISMRMREGWDEYVDANSAAFGGYTGDESSNESDSGSDLELFQSPCRKSFAETDFCGFPSSSYVSSSVNREAKKQICERWKMNQKYQGLEMNRNGSTLAEMLALSDRESTPTYSASKSCLGRVNSQFHTYNVAMNNNIPLGISSRDGWKDDVNTRPSRSRSLSASFGSSAKCLYADELAKNLHERSFTASHDRKREKKGNLNSKEEYYLPIRSSSSYEKPYHCQKLNDNEAYCFEKASFKSEPSLSSSDVSGEPLSSQVVVDEGNEVALVLNPGSIIISSAASDINHEHSSDGSINSVVQEAPALRSSHPEPESSESSKEADHSSPISVLEAPCRGDKSSDQRIEEANSELHELRKQPQPREKEHDANANVTPRTDQETPSSVSENFTSLATECWQNAYVVDLLIRSLPEDSDFGTNWDYPLDPKLFEDLEKKYNNGVTGSKSERRLLFDRLNSVLLEILEEHVDSFSWVMPKLGGLFSKWEKEAVGDAIGRLMNEDFSQWDESERGLDKKMQWSDARGEINLVGVEMESLLIDEIIWECCLVC